MRKTSQDGGDSTSATSGVENEIKKPKAGLLLEFKSKKLGKRTAPNLSEETDDAVVEPLLQKNTNTTIQSAKYFAKAKADTVKEISKLFNDKKSQYASKSDFGTTETLLSEKDQVTPKSNLSNTAPLHNYMNTNIFHSHDSSKANGTTKSQLLVEIDGSNKSGYNPSPLIFTTAKIHTDGNSEHMEPVQMTPAPILSTVELSFSKDGGIKTNEKKVRNDTSVVNTTYSQPQSEIPANIINSNVTTVTQSKDDLAAKPANPCKSFTSIAKNSAEVLPHPAHVNENARENTVNTAISNVTPVPQSNIPVKSVNPSKSITILSQNTLEKHPLSETSTSMTPNNGNDKPVTPKDIKMLVDEPRIVLSESMLKSTNSEVTMPNVSIKTTKPSLAPILVPKSKQPKSSQLNQNEKTEAAKKETCIEKLLIKNAKSPTVPKDFDKISDINSTDHVKQTNNISTTIDTLASKTEIKMESSKNPESKISSAKSSSPSTKNPTQSKAIDITLSKEIDKPKPSTNEITKINSTKISLNNTAISSSNKISTSASVVKIVPSINSSNVVSSTVSNTTTTTLNSALTKSKAIPSTVTTTTPSSSAIKTQVTSTKTTSTENTKPTSGTSTKSFTIPSSTKSGSSTKSPQITTTQIISAVKQSNTSSAKIISSKQQSHASPKPTAVNTSNSSVTTATESQPTVSKLAQVSASKPLGNSSSTASSTTAAVKATNNTKTKAPESNKKSVTKSSDHTKDTKALQ